MTLTMQLQNLSSRVVRRTIGDTTGVRRFAVSAFNQQNDEEGNSLNIWGGISRFFGSLLETIWERFQAGVLTFTKIMGFIVSTVNYVMNFNWNADLSTVNQAMQTQLDSLAGSLGGLIGSTIGYLVCGGIPGVVLFSFNEALALYVLKELGEEALEELAGKVENIVRQGFTLLGRGLLEYGFVLLKSGVTTTFSSLTNAFLNNVGADATKIQNAQKSRKEPWSFAKGINDAIETIPIQAIQNFVEELLEETADSCIEAGYVIANSFDAQMAANQLANQGTFGEREAVEVIFNRESIAPVTP